MLRQEKERIVSELADRLKSSETLLVADYRGLTMTEIDELRTKLLESGARFSVVKNTLTRRAAEEAGVQQLLELIEGPTAIAFIDADGDPAAAAKILNDTARTNDVLVIRGGLLEGDAVGDAEIKRLATLPPTDVLRAQLVGAVSGPLTTIVGLFTAPLRDLVGVIDARIEQLREQGDTGESEAPAAEEPQAEAAAEEPQAEETAEEPQAEAAADEPQAEPEAASGDEPQAAAEPEAQTETEASSSAEGDQPPAESAEEEQADG